MMGFAGGVEDELSSVGLRLGIIRCSRTVGEWGGVFVPSVGRLEVNILYRCLWEG